MDAAIKEKWVKALRSGDYRQGSGALRRQKGNDGLFCCLGVLCDISGRGRWREPNSDEGAEFHYVEETFAVSTCLNVYQQLDFGISREHHRDLYTMNDGGKSFPEIATWIEQNIPVSDHQSDASQQSAASEAGGQ